MTKAHQRMHIAQIRKFANANRIPLRRAMRFAILRSRGFSSEFARIKIGIMEDSA